MPGEFEAFPMSALYLPGTVALPSPFPTAGKVWLPSLDFECMPGLLTGHDLHLLAIGNLVPPSRSIVRYVRVEHISAVFLLNSTPDPDDSEWVIKLLTKAPRGLALNHPMFAIHVLTECASRSQELERRAMGCLISNCFSFGFVQVMPGGGSAPTPMMQDSAAPLLALCEPGSLAFKLYTAIANARPPSFPDILDDFEDLDEA